MRFFFLRLRRRWRKWLALIIFLLLLSALIYFVFNKMQPLIADLATAKVSNQVIRVVASAVNEAMNNGDIEYDRLFTFQTDTAGRITALSSNMAEFNRLKSLIETDVLERLSEVSTSTLRIPIGTLSGVTLLSGRGPALEVKMQSVGYTNARFENEFTAAGINQTKHKILLDVDVRVSVLLPGFRAGTQVSGQYVVAETIIVGDVPESYTYFHSKEEDIEDSIINDT